MFETDITKAMNSLRSDERTQLDIIEETEHHSEPWNDAMERLMAIRKCIDAMIDLAELDA
jgi:hypothetical protein